MNYLKAAILLAFLALAGCLAGPDRSGLSRRTDVFGAELFSGVDYRVINGVSATDEPCLRGYERTFEPLEIVLGYGEDRKIRKITTRNPATSILGISPGAGVGEGRQRAEQAGLAEVAKNRYQGDGVSLRLLTDETGRIFGLTLERID